MIIGIIHIPVIAGRYGSMLYFNNHTIFVDGDLFSLFSDAYIPECDEYESI